MREVVACAKKKILGLLKSFYEDVTTVPNYGLINELGNFDILIIDEQRLIMGMQRDGASSMPSPPSSESDLVTNVTTNASSLAELEANYPLLLEPHLSSARSSLIPDTRLHSANTPPSNDLYLASVDLPSEADGLHSTQFEEPSANQDIDDNPDRLNEVE